MTDERNDAAGDRVVSNRYKQLAVEKAPDRLDKNVMRMAAAAARTPYARMRTWIRPAAWAATICLSLAIVLQQTQLPETGLDAVNASLPNQDADIEKDRQGIKREDVAASTAPASSASGAKVKDTAQAEPLPAPTGRNKSTASVAERPGDSTMDAFVPKDMGVLQEAEDRARAQAGPDRLPAKSRTELRATVAEDRAVDEIAAAEDSPAASFSMATTTKELATEQPCPARIRESADTWFVCIEALREDGADDLAQSEYEEFQRIFPDFVDSTDDK